MAALRDEGVSRCLRAHAAVVCAERWLALPAMGCAGHSVASRRPQPSPRLGVSQMRQAYSKQCLSPDGSATANACAKWAGMCRASRACKEWDAPNDCRVVHCCSMHPSSPSSVGAQGGITALAMGALLLGHLEEPHTTHDAYPRAKQQWPKQQSRSWLATSIAEARVPLIALRSHPHDYAAMRGHRPKSKPPHSRSQTPIDRGPCSPTLHPSSPRPPSDR